MMGYFIWKEPYKQPYTYEGAMRMYLAGEISQDEFLEIVKATVRKSRYKLVETVNSCCF